MRLLHSILPHLHQTKKPQPKFLTHLLGLLLLLPGPAPFRNLSRYSFYQEKTFARWYARDGPIGKKGAPYAAFFRGVTNAWGVSPGIAADG